MSKISDIKKMVAYIDRYANELSIPERQNILQIIHRSVPDEKIHTKGSGTLINYNDIPRATINDIYSYVKRQITQKEKQLEYFSEEDDTGTLISDNK
jgi:hypothetical protein